MRSESREPGRPKVCSKCKIRKEATEYYLHKGLLRSRCKACSHQDAAGSARRRAYLYAWQAANPGKVAEAQRRYRETNRESRLLSNRQWHAKNKDVARAIASAKRARKRGAVAQWDVELTDFVGRECAALAQMREAATGFAWHVDHTVPISGRDVCGLHVWSNLRVIPAISNIVKSNRYDERLDGRFWL